MEAIEEFTNVESIFVRHRNCLVVRGKFAPIFTDYYLNLMQHSIRQNRELDSMMKELMAYFTLHVAASPWAERHAWTITLRAPRCNLFVTGSSLEEAVVGRVFTENVREPDSSILYAQLYKDHLDTKTSSIRLQSTMPAEWIEDFYVKSEQRMARCIEMSDEEYVLAIAQPDADIEWLVEQDEDSIRKLAEKEEIKLLETRRFRFHCGCTLNRILPALGVWRNKLDELFSGEPTIEVICPRCAARYEVTREMML